MVGKGSMVVFALAFFLAMGFVCASGEISYLSPSPANNSIIYVSPNASNYLDLIFNASINLSSEYVSDFAFDLDDGISPICAGYFSLVNQAGCDNFLLSLGQHKIRANVYLNELIISQPEKVAYTANFSGQNGGNNWNNPLNASYNLAVLSDENISTVYGISGSKVAELTFNFSLTNITKVEISWYAAPPNKVTNITGKPEVYYFGYWDGSAWVYPSEWNSSENYQDFNVLHEISLNTPIETTKIKMTRNIASSGIGISEFHILDDSKINTALGEWVYFNVTQDNFLPTFDFTPANIAITAGESFSVDFNATDDSPLTWSVNDSNFLIDENGTLTNNATLSVGVYSILVTVTDAFNNSNSKVYELTVNAVTSSSRGGGGGSRSRTVVNETIVQNVTAPVFNETVNSTANETTTDNAPTGFLPLTGAFIGTTTGKISVGIIVFLIALGGAYWIVAAKRKNKGKKN